MHQSKPSSVSHTAAGSNRRSALRCCFSLWAVCCLGNLAFGQDEGVSALRPDDIVELLSGERLPLVDFEKAWRALAALDPETRDDTLRVLVVEGHEHYAASAARALIYDRVAGISQLITAQVGTWSDESQRAALRAIQTSETEEALRDVPRRVLENLLDSGSPGEVADALSSAIDIAARLLADSDESKDEELLRSAVRTFPQSRGLWLALAEADAVQNVELTLALSTQIDPQLPLVVRIAAAVAAAPQDERAARFAHEQIEAFIARFGDKSLAGWAASLSSGEADSPAKRAYHQFERDKRMIGMLRVLKTPLAQQLTIQALVAENQVIRMTGGLVAVERWPQVLVSLGQTVPKFKMRMVNLM